MKLFTMETWFNTRLSMWNFWTDTWMGLSPNNLVFPCQCSVVIYCVMLLRCAIGPTSQNINTTCPSPGLQICSKHCWDQGQGSQFQRITNSTFWCIIKMCCKLAVTNWKVSLLTEQVCLVLMYQTCMW